MSNLSGRYRIFTTDTVVGTLAVHILDRATNRPIGQIFFSPDITGEDIAKVAGDLKKLMDEELSA